MEDRWGSGPAPDADELAQLVYLSNLIGRESRLVQPGGGNTSIKVGDALLVKGSGTDLRTVGREGFTRLSLAALTALRTADSMPDTDMMRFMARAMLADGPAPSVETPLHSLLPHRVIAHTHDVPTMSLTNVSDAVAERLVTELFAGDIVYVPYVRPGFPLAQAISGIADQLPPGAIGLALAHHGLVVWGEDPRECYTRLLRAVNVIDDYLATKRRGHTLTPTEPAHVPPADVRRHFAELVLPIVRGVLGSTNRVILHFDDADDVLTALTDQRMPARSLEHSPTHRQRRRRWHMRQYTQHKRRIPPHTH
jgi:rhamnose utilization protein RhaD (predicted bifunctional aldolase and dehydrogenase)